MNFKTMKIEDIIDWCKANGQVDWLKAEAAKKVECKVYPKVMKDGKKVADKTQAPTIEYRPMPYVTLKTNFVNKFMPEIAPKAKTKKPSMYELINAL